MWTLEDDPNCEATYVSFRLLGDELKPAAIEEAIGLIGDFSAAKGELRSSSSGREVRQRTGVWLISSKGRVASTSVERHIRHLLDQLEPVKAKLLAVARDQGAVADFYCYWVSLTDQGGPGVSPDALRRMSELEATLAFDLYSSASD